MTPGEDFIASVSTFAGNFAPLDYADCDGKLLQIKEYPAVFSILGTMYGGDGKTTFAVPDLRPTKDGRKVDWAQLSLSRQVICLVGIYPVRP
jgi:microcystin-dependent protein